MSPEFAASITDLMLGKLGISAPSTISLNQLTAPGQTEHAASLTRLDAVQGNPEPVIPDLVQSILDDTIPLSSSVINTFSLGTSRARRESESITVGSQPLSTGDLETGINEAALLLMILGTGGADPLTWTAKKDLVKEFLLVERFPVELGYAKSLRPFVAADMTLLATSIRATYDQLMGPALGPAAPPLPVPAPAAPAADAQASAAALAPDAVVAQIEAQDIDPSLVDPSLLDPSLQGQEFDPALQAVDPSLAQAVPGPQDIGVTAERVQVRRRYPIR